ncbi:MAG: HAD-IIIA family hydrolase [Bacteroidia bacterium]
MKKVIMIMGFPGSGKSTYTKKLISDGWINFNRDIIANTSKLLAFLAITLEDTIQPNKQVVLDNTYGTIESRKPIIDLAKKNGYEIECWEMETSFEDAQFNAVQRQIERLGKYPTPEELKAAKDVNLFPPAVIYAYKKNYQKPTLAEGFDVIKKNKFVRSFPADYTNKAIIFDYDGTLRETISGAKYPIDPYDIRILPGRKEKLQALKDAGYILLGLSNQSGVAKGHLSHGQAVKCFKRTNDLLGFDIDVEFCSHSIPPVICYCRKPAPGYGVHFIHKYKLDPSKVIMVGDMTSDETFAKRCGFKYKKENEFFI